MRTLCKSIKQDKSKAFNYDHMSVGLGNLYSITRFQGVF